MVPGGNPVLVEFQAVEGVGEVNLVEFVAVGQIPEELKKRGTLGLGVGPREDHDRQRSTDPFRLGGPAFEGPVEHRLEERAELFMELFGRVAGVHFRAGESLADEVEGNLDPLLHDPGAGAALRARGRVP